MATAGVLMKKVLGGAGKGVAKIANAVDDAEAVMKNAAMNATDAISDVYRTTSNAYRTTRMQSAKVIDEMEEGIRDAAGKKIKKPKIKEARVSGNESNNVVDEAINHNNTVKVTYSRDGNKYYRQVEGGKRQKIDSKLYGTVNGRRISNDKATNPSHKNYTGANYSKTFTMEEEIADDISKTAAGDGAGIDLLQFASGNPVGTALAGIGVGIIGANIFDDD